MAKLIVISWRDIPAQVVVKKGRETGKVQLSHRFQEAVDRQGEKFKVPADRRYTGLNCFRKMLDAGGIDIAAVLTPPYFHPEQVEAAVEAGVHVWLAKPIAVDAPGVARIEAAARKAKGRRRRRQEGL